MGGIGQNLQLQSDGSEIVCAIRAPLKTYAYQKNECTRHYTSWVTATSNDVKSEQSLTTVTPSNVKNSIYICENVARYEYISALNVKIDAICEKITLWVNFSSCG